LPYDERTPPHEEATSMNKTKTAKYVSITAVGALAAILTGCASTDPSPSVAALGRSDAEVSETYTISSDTNYRAIINDLERAFYTDRPSRLSPNPIPH
jgi:hypothetical protein